VEEEEEQQQQASADVEPQAATSGGLPNLRTNTRNTNILHFVGPARGVKKVRLHTLTKTAHRCLC